MRKTPPTTATSITMLGQRKSPTKDNTEFDSDWRITDHTGKHHHFTTRQAHNDSGSVVKGEDKTFHTEYGPMKANEIAGLANSGGHVVSPNNSASVSDILKG